jgi:aminoglycoside phosphotransferase (APT) family kinase protein
LEDVIAAICKNEAIYPHSITPLSGGQVNQVYRINESLILRIGGRGDAYQRFSRETRIIQDLQNQIPIAGITAFGVYENWVYQVQPYVVGEKLYRVWKGAAGKQKDSLIRQLTTCMRTLHARRFPAFGSAYDPGNTQTSWPAYFDNLFHQTLKDLRTHKLSFPADLLMDVEHFYDKNKHFLQEDTPCLVHADLNPGNILVNDGHITAILDFEYAMAAPREYECVGIEQFCLYPNDYAELEYEIYTTADFADYFQRIVRFYPDVFASPHLRQRVDLYAIESGIHSFLEWGKEHPVMSADARMHPVARAANFMVRNGARLF